MCSSVSDSASRLKGATLLLLFAILISPAVAEDRPNILLIVADDLGWGDVGWHDGPFQTPVLDELVRTGIELDRQYVQPVCSPTRACLLSGQWNSRFGPHVLWPTNLRVFPPGTVTLATALKECGYSTLLSGKWHLGSRPEWGPNHYGFHYSYGSLAGAIDPWTHDFIEGPYLKTWHRDEVLLDEPGNATDLITSQAVRWIHSENQPWFLYVPFQAVHIPIDTPEKYLRMYQSAEFDPDPVRNESLRRFGAFVTQMDACIGELVTALNETGQRERTLILFLSDNGGLSGGKNPFAGTVPDSPALSSNLPLKGEKDQLYEGGIRVAAVINWPARLSPGKLTTPLHAVDWMPTLTHLAGWKPKVPPESDGIDVWPLLTGEQTPTARSIYIPHLTGAVVLRDGWKLISRNNGTFELYQVFDDPGEERERSATEPERLEEMQQELHRLRQLDLRQLPKDLEGIPSW